MKALLFLLLGAVTFASCNKKIILPEESIIAGVTKNMVFSYKTKVIYATPQHPDKSYQLDIDEDGIMDLRFHCTLDYVAGIGSVTESWIEPLHEGCKFLVQDVMEERYVHYGFQLTTDQMQNPIAIQTTTYSCEPSAQSNTLDTTLQVRTLSPKLFGDEISIKHSFESESIYLKEASSSTFGPTGLVVNGVTYYDLITYYKGCNPFSAGEYKYLGIKFEYPTGIRRLGWLYLNIEGSKIRIGGWAIQSVVE